MHRASRILSTMLITAGLVVLADAGLTLVWQEPLSAAYGSLRQGQAEDDLRALEAEYPTEADLAAIEDVSGVAAKARILADRFEPRLREGEGIGRIEIPGIDQDIVIVQGTDTPSLQKGPGHYKATSLPGQPGTVAIAGHRTTYLAPFRKINEIKDGDEIRLEMPYAASPPWSRSTRSSTRATSKSPSRSATSVSCSPPVTRSTAPPSAGRRSRGSSESICSRSAAAAGRRPNRRPPASAPGLLPSAATTTRGCLGE